jgi:hypothetical protein
MVREYDGENVEDGFSPPSYLLTFLTSCFSPSHPLTFLVHYDVSALSSIFTGILVWMDRIYAVRASRCFSVR